MFFSAAEMPPPSRVVSPLPFLKQRQGSQLSWRAKIADLTMKIAPKIGTKPNNFKKKKWVHAAAPSVRHAGAITTLHSLSLQTSSSSSSFSRDPWLLHDVSSPVFLRHFARRLTWLQAEQECQRHYGHLVRGRWHLAG